MTARPVKQKDPLHGVAMQRSGGKCEVAKKLAFGATDLYGSRDAAIVERCAQPIESVFWQDDNSGTVAMCHECRLRVFGLTSGEKRKRTMSNKSAQLALQVRDRDKP